MVDIYLRPKGVSEDTWQRLLFHYPDTVRRIYNIAKAPGFAYRGRTKYDAINEQIKTIVSFLQYREVLSIWRDQLLSTTQADPTPKLTPNNTTRQIVICKT
jgi:hypothetical protein